MPFAFDNLEMIRKVKCPVLMVNGVEDATIPRGMPRALELAVKSPLTRLEVPGAGHQNLFELGGDSVWQGVFEFIDGL